MLLIALCSVKKRFRFETLDIKTLRGLIDKKETAINRLKKCYPFIAVFLLQVITILYFWFTSFLEVFLYKQEDYKYNFISDFWVYLFNFEVIKKYLLIIVFIISYLFLVLSNLIIIKDIKKNLLISVNMLMWHFSIFITLFIWFYNDRGDIYPVMPFFWGTPPNNAILAYLSIKKDIIFVNRGNRQYKDDKLIIRIFIILYILTNFLILSFFSNILFIYYNDILFLAFLLFIILYLSILGILGDVTIEKQYDKDNNYEQKQKI